MLEKEKFIARLTELRMSKGVSAREMSLAIGQSPGYINNIENGINLPSMMAFFYICEYLHITPGEFFDLENKGPDKLYLLTEKLKHLDRRQLDLVTMLVSELIRE